MSSKEFCVDSLPIVLVVLFWHARYIRFIDCLANA